MKLVLNSCQRAVVFLAVLNLTGMLSKF